MEGVSDEGERMDGIAWKLVLAYDQQQEDHQCLTNHEFEKKEGRVYYQQDNDSIGL